MQQNSSEAPPPLSILEPWHCLCTNSEPAMEPTWRGVHQRLLSHVLGDATLWCTPRLVAVLVPRRRPTSGVECHEHVC